jgi:PAS domain S-box-containing protein
MHMDVGSTASSPLLDRLFEEPGAGRCLVAPDGSVLRANREWLRSTGFRLDDVLGADVVGLFPETRDLTLALHARARAGHHVDVPPHAQRLGGREAWYEGSVDPIPMDGGTGLLLTVRQLEAVAPGCADPSCGSLLDVVNDAVFVHDAETGAILDANRRAEEMYEVSRAELLGGTVERFSVGEPPYTAREALAHIRAAAAGESRLFEWHARTGSGRPFWVEVNLRCVGRGRCGRLFAVVRDVTDRRRVQDALRESEQKLRLLADAMPQIVCVLGPDGRAEYVNARWTEFSGLDLRATQIAGWDAVLHPEDVPAARATRVRALKLQQPVEVELRYRAADGSFRWFLSRIAPVVEGGRVIRFVGAAMEIEDRKRTELVLREQLALQDQLARVAASVPGVVCSFRLRPDGAVSMPFSAPAIEELYGFPQDVLARDMAPALSRTHPDDLARTREEIERSAASLSPWRASFRYEHPRKGLRWIEGASIPSREPDGAVVWHGYVADVTDHRRAEEALRRSEEEFRTLADAIPQLVWMNQPDGAAEYFNEQWRGYTGIGVERDPEAWARALHPDDRERTLARWRRSLAAGEPYETEFRLRSARTGTHRWFLARALPIRDDQGRIRRWFGTCTDIDEQKRVEDELLAAKQHAAQIAERLKEEHRRKDEFLGMLSHELRNPLAPIRNSVYVLRHARAGDAERPLAVIERQTAHLTRLVDDLLDVTRIARGKIQLHRERLELRELVRRTGEDFRSVLEERGVVFRLALPDRRVHADADPTRITQVIGNLLHNAAKFTRPGDDVTLSLEALPGVARIRVVDTGAGIEPSLLPAVFDPFVQADRTLARTEGGLGLGLALVKGIVELHGGAVAAESAGTGKGTAFRVDLPLAPEQVAAAPAPRAGTAPAPGHRVLVVDDNHDAADSLAELVRVMGHDVVAAYDPETALARVETEPPDVVLCDLGLPRIDGFEVARRIRAAAPGRVRLVAVSGYAQPEDVTRALEAGFDAHVAKPADPQRIEELLG